MRENLQSYACCELYESNSNYLVLKLRDNNKHVIGFYRPGSAPFSLFNTRMMHLMSQYRNTVLIGDANIDLLRQSAEMDEYMTTISSNGFFIMNNVNNEFPTRAQVVDRFVQIEVSGQ